MNRKIAWSITAGLLLMSTQVMAEWKTLDKSWHLGPPFSLLGPRPFNDVDPQNGIVINAPFYATKIRVIISERCFSRKQKIPLCCWSIKRAADYVRICDKNGTVYKKLFGKSTREETYEVPSNGIRVQVFSCRNSVPETFPNDHIDIDHFEYFIPDGLVIDEHFPENFFWGAATSAFQVEGNSIGTDWWEWANGSPEHCKGDRIGLATDHYNRYEEDFDIAQKMGLKMFRLGIEWARIEPEKGVFSRDEIEHYRRVLEALKKRGIEPMVTLHHFSQPTWFANQGGFEKEENIEDFLEYVEKITNEFKDLITYYITINEPSTLALGGWTKNGGLPPGKNDLKLASEVYANCFVAHARAYHAIKSIQPQAKVSLAKHMRVIIPNPGYLIDDPTLMTKKITKAAGDFMNEAFLDAILTGNISIILDPLSPTIRNVPELRGALDFFAVNYYTRDRMFFNIVEEGNIFGLNIMYRSEQHEYTPMGHRWEYSPDCIYSLMMRLKKFSEDFNNLPGIDHLLEGIIICENGVGDVNDIGLATETMRPQFIIDHLHFLYMAIQDGADVRGYLHWSLLDNFELAEGYRAQFGLIGVDCRNDAGLTRIWKNSAYLYQQIIKNNGLTNDVIPYVKQ